MILFGWILYLVAFVNFFLGLLVLAYGARKKPNQYFFLLTFLLAVWAVFHAQSISSGRDILFWTRITLLPGTLVPVAFLFFSRDLIFPSSFPKSISLITWGVGPILMLLALNPHFIETARLLEWGVSWHPGPIYYFYAAYFLILMGSGLYILYKKIHRVDGNERRQLVYVFWGSFISSVFGFVFNIFKPIFWSSRYCHFGPVATVFLVSCIAYAIMKHRLMDIRIAIRRTALFLLIYGGIGGLVGFGIFEFNRSFFPGALINSPIFAIELLIIGFFFFFGAFLYGGIIRRSEFFQESTLAGLTHELKSPLSVIESAMDVLEQFVEKTDVTNSKKEYIAMVNRNTSRLRKYVDSLLSVYGDQDPGASLNRKNLDIRKLWDDILLDYENEINRKEIEVSISSPVDGALVYGDEKKISMIISNLLSNALKFTNSGRIEINIGQDGKSCVCSVRDTGSGFDPSEAKLVFDRFYQGKSHKSEKGSGIGLTVAKIWVDAHGGKIWAESGGPGKGATFTFKLPV